jgi:hypothetical protein
MTYYDPKTGQGAARPSSAQVKQIQSNTFSEPADSGRKISYAQIASIRGTWFDPALDFREPEGDDLTAAVLSLIDENSPRQRNLKKADAQNRYAIVRAILANGFRCHFHRRSNRVTFHGRNNGYKDIAGRPPWLNQGAMPAAVRLLAAARLINTYPGQLGRASTYHIMPRLYGIAQTCGITDHSLTYPLPRERLVRLREGNSTTPYLSFEQTDDTCRWTDQLEAYNAFLRRQDIALELTKEEHADWVRHWNEERRGRLGTGSSLLVRPERFQTDLYRQFNNGSFDQGGRLYGGWWINTPGRLRKRITINGEPTVELDYSGCHIRMLYHQLGIDYQEDDPYRLDELSACEEANGLQVDHFREGMKQLSQALINGNPSGQPHLAKIKDFSFRPYFRRPELRRLFEDKHAPIASAFGTGEGLRLQRQDSDIALSIITRLRDQGVAALPVHDSFIVVEDQEKNLNRLMEEEYFSVFGCLPKIKRDI